VSDSTSAMQPSTTPSLGVRGVWRAVQRHGPAITTGLIVVAMFAAWEWATTTELVHGIVLPSPAIVFEELNELVREPAFWTALRVTGQEIVVGLAIGSGMGIATALLATRYPLFRAVLSPYITAFQAVPKVLVLPLLSTWFGIGILSATIVVALVSFFPTYVNTYTGLNLRAEQELRLLYSLGATRRQAFRMVRVPVALPFVFSGIKISIAFGVTSAIVTEFLGAGDGLGHLVTEAGLYLNVGRVYAAVAAITVLASLIFLAVEMLDRKLVFWRVDLNAHDRGGSSAT
jgi:NitT/TauT family transport system permease protein